MESRLWRQEIEPALQEGYDLNDLLRGITPEKLHEAVDFGPPEGKEAA